MYVCCNQVFQFSFKRTFLYIYRWSVLLDMVTVQLEWVKSNRMAKITFLGKLWIQAPFIAGHVTKCPHMPSTVVCLEQHQYSKYMWSLTQNKLNRNNVNKKMRYWSQEKCQCRLLFLTSTNMLHQCSPLQAGESNSQKKNKREKRPIALLNKKKVIRNKFTS